VAARNHFQPYATSVDKLPHQLAQLGAGHFITCRMRNDSLTTRTAYPSDRRRQLCPLAWHESRLAVDQIVFEHGTHRIGIPGLHQRTRKMSPADQTSVGKREGTLEHACDTGLRQAVSDFLGTPIAEITHARQPLQNFLVPRIYPKADDMHGTTVPCHRDFDAWHEPQAQAFCSRCSLGNALEGIVVRQSHHLHAGRMRMLHQFCRAESPIRGSGVGVQIVSGAHFFILSQPLSADVHNKAPRPGFTLPVRCIDLAAMKPDSVDIAYLYESFCEFTENLQEAWENSPQAESDASHPQRLIDAMSQLAGILRTIEESGNLPAGTNQDVHTLGEFGVQLLKELSEIAARLHQPEPARGLQNLCLPMAVWTARHGGEIRHLTPVVNALSYFAKHSVDPEFMMQLLSLTHEIFDAVSPRVVDEDANHPDRPWRMLVLNRAFIATRTLQPSLMEPVFDSVVELLPEDAAQFFEEGMEQMEMNGYPEPVRNLMTRYFQAFGRSRVLH